MSDLRNEHNVLNFNIHNKADQANMVKIYRALANKDRLRIMEMVSAKSCNIYELSVNLAIPLSSVFNHVNILTDAGLILSVYKPTLNGHERICSKALFALTTEFAKKDVDSNLYTVEMPIGLYSDIAITPPCGILSAKEQIENFDDPITFFSPKRSMAELLWFNSGYISYKFPINSRRPIEEISFSFEICSETVYYNENWKSDITVELNDIELLTFTSMGDYGGRRGNYSPLFWPITSTQFGKLVTIKVNQNGTFFNDTKYNKITIQTLATNENNIKFTLKIKDTARHVGGLNLFGKNFGDYNQAIIMKIIYQ